MRALLPLVSLVALSAAAPVAHAQVADGLREINASGSLPLTTADAHLFHTVILGLFVTDRIELGVSADAVLSGDVELVYLGGSVAYHFGAPGTTAVPFVGGEAAVGLADAEGLVVEGQAGLKYFVAEGGALVGAAYVQVPTEGDVALGARAGIAVFF